MTETLELHQIILLSVPFIILCVAAARINLSKDKRGKQVIMPVIAVIFCVIAMFEIAKLQLKIEDILSEHLTSKSLFSESGVGPFVIYGINIAIICVYICVKCLVLRLLVDPVWKSDKVMKETSFCYELVQIPLVADPDSEDIKPEDQVEEDESEKGASKVEEDTDSKAKEASDESSEEDRKLSHTWCCKRKYDKFRIFFKGFYYALFAITIIIFIFSQWKRSWPVFQVPFYPVFGIIILGEICFYLDGPERPLTKPAKKKAKKARRVVDHTPFEELRKVFHKLYPQRILLSDITTDDEIIQDEWFIPSEWYNESATQAQKAAAAYFSKVIESSNTALNDNYVNSALKLVQGQSVLISNPFYRDLTDYILLPLMKQILSFKKCLIIVGRDSTAEDVKSWLDAGLSKATGTPNLWKTEILTPCQTDAEIAILRANDIYNTDIQTLNESFLKKLGFVLIIEPSHILATGQLGLSLLVSRYESNAEKIVYCAVDRNCDGLVDALSHTFKTSITEVTATISSSCGALRLYWDANGPYMHHKLEGLGNIAHYLGMGTELSLIALKNRGNANDTPITWVSSDKFPVIDIKWIDGQYYKKLCEYAQINVSQAALEKEFRFEPNLWFDKKSEEAYLTIEDEFQNLFEITRLFGSRATRLLLINVISEHYFLRDYMVDNVNLFLTDSKAIPTIVPEFARSPRNIILKLLVMMSQAPVREEVIRREFEFCNLFQESLTSEDSILPTIQSFIRKYYSDREIAVISTLHSNNRNSSQFSERTFSLKDGSAINSYLNTLKTAYFYTEDEIGNDHYIAARLYGHVFQSFLAGQFVTLDGKYYQVQSITPQNGVVLRRAADHITNRIYYRQLRSIHISSWEQESAISVAGIERALGTATFSVSTTGYLEMTSWHDLKTAKPVMIGDIPQRFYMNKSALRVKLPGVSAKVRYTLCLLLNEIFRTTYPDSNQYICAVVPLDELDPVETRHVIYPLDGPCDQDSFYVLEDSEIDMGLIISVERNLRRYFEIIADVLAWHFEKMNEKPIVPVKPKKSSLEEQVKAEEEARLRAESLGSADDVDVRTPLQRFIDWIRSLFGWKRPEKPAPEPEPVVEEPQEDPVIFDDNRGSDPTMTKYQENCFLKFGFDNFDETLDLEGTLVYLTSFGFHINPLSQVRANDLNKKDKL